eukprot:3083229-Heterocapsa_arctica.AAC.1
MNGLSKKIGADLEFIALALSGVSDKMIFEMIELLKTEQLVQLKRRRGCRPRGFCIAWPPPGFDGSAPLRGLPRAPRAAAMPAQARRNAPSAAIGRGVPPGEQEDPLGCCAAGEARFRGGVFAAGEAAVSPTSAAESELPDTKGPMDTYELLEDFLALEKKEANGDKAIGARRTANEFDELLFPAINMNVYIMTREFDELLFPASDVSDCMTKPMFDN